jgi:hypothetical protein
MRQARSDISRLGAGSEIVGSVVLPFGATADGPRFFLRLRDLVEAVLTNFSNFREAQKELIIHIRRVAFKWTHDDI